MGISGRSTLGVLWRYRPRFLTLLVLFVVAVPIMLANLTSEIEAVPDWRSPGDVCARGRYGWPLNWHWHNLAATPASEVIIGWEYSRARLAANLVIWIMLLAVPAAACEWQRRRYRPGFRWSLRSMLATMAVAAVFCAWFAVARNRAKLQDPMIAELDQHYSYRETVVVERLGPKWLEFVVPDRFRRHIIGIDSTDAGAVDESFVARFEQLPRLKYLKLHVEQLTPAMTAALRNLRQLRWLDIEVEQPSSYTFAALGKLAQLEGLFVHAPRFSSSNNLPHLAGLTNLKRFSVEYSKAGGAFSQMPALPNLEAISFIFSSVSGQDLRRLSVLPRLKAFDLKYADLDTDAKLADLAKLDSLEELIVAGHDVSAEGLESLAAIKHLKALHISNRKFAFYKGPDVIARLELDGGYGLSVLETEIDGFQWALSHLRQSHPGIVIDGDVCTVDRRFEREPPWVAFACAGTPERPWDALEPSTLRSTWLPARFAWVSPPFFAQAGAKASGAANSSTTAE